MSLALTELFHLGTEIPQMGVFGSRNSPEAKERNYNDIDLRTDIYKKVFSIKEY